MKIKSENKITINCNIIKNNECLKFIHSDNLKKKISFNNENKKSSLYSERNHGERIKIIYTNGNGFVCFHPFFSSILLPLHPIIVHVTRILTLDSMRKIIIYFLVFFFLLLRFLWCCFCFH